MGRRVNIFGAIPKSNFWCIFDVFLNLVFLVYFNAISIDFYAVNCLSALMMCNFHVYNWENADIKDLNA